MSLLSCSMRQRILFLFLLFLLQKEMQSQIKHLVFEGAGIRGIAYAGAIEELEQQHKLDEIIAFGGTSAGAITSTMLAFGYTGRELDSIISSTRFQRFNDGRFLFVGGVYRFSKRFGWYRGERFSSWMGNLIKLKCGNADITFKEAHERGFKDLFLTATSLIHQESLVLSYKNFPDMKIKDAVRISMSIPLYYQAVYIDSAGHTFKKQNKDGTYNMLVDGGILMNFPIQIFDSVYIDHGEKKRIANKHTLGIRIDSDEQIHNDLTQHRLAKIPISNLGDYLSAFYTITLEQLNRQSLTTEDWQRTIQISNKGIGPKVKKLSRKQKELLVESGRESVKRFLTGK
jgi:NTE family protein